MQNDSVWIILDMVGQLGEDYNQQSLQLVEAILKTKGLKQESVTGAFRCLLLLFAQCRTPVAPRAQPI